MNICIIVSIINSGYTIFNPEQRLQQTVHTIKTVREKIPNCYIILAELSTLSEYQKKQLFSVENPQGANILYDFSTEAVTEGLLSPHKTKGACWLFINSWKKLQEINPPPHDSKIFMISGRYFLNDNFKFENYNNDKINIRVEYEQNPLAIYTNLFSCSIQHVEYLSSIFQMVSDRNALNMEEYLERLFYRFINLNICKQHPILGIEGLFSVNGNLCKA